MPEMFDTADPSTNKLWAKRLWTSFRKKDVIWDDGGLIGSNPDENAIVVKDEFQKSTGDKLTMTISYQVQGRGVIGDDVLEGKEVPIETKTMSMVIDEQAFGYRSRGVMNGQRVNFDVLDECRRKNRDWWATRRAVAGINHLCGNSRQTDLAYTGLNTITEPDANHIYRVNQGLGASNDETVGGDNTAKIDIGIIDKLVTIAESLDQPIPPMIYKGNPYYGLIIHPFSAEDLRSTSAKWYEVMVNALQGGQVNDNPLFNRAMGMWRNTLIFVDPHVPAGKHSGTGASVRNSRRCVFFGAGALCVAYGRRERGTKEHFVWHSGTWDHGRKYYGSSSCVWGVKGAEFPDPAGTTRLNGRIVVTVYSLDRLAYTYNGVTTYDYGQPSN